MNENLTSSAWAPASSRTRSPAPHAVAKFHNILDETTNRAPAIPQPVPKRSNPPTSRPVTALQSRYFNRCTAVDRYTRLFRRLRHKSHFLIWSHHQALKSSTIVSAGSLQWTMDPGEAETMFRVDFFEWYVLLERCLVAALAAVEIGVSATYDPLGSAMVMETAREGFAASNGSIIGDRNVFQAGTSHRFHANVLSALDQVENNPLHEILGAGMVRQYIGVAKEFRNKWKDVESSTGAGETDEEGFSRRLKKYGEILKDLKLDEMLDTILRALESARHLIANQVSTLGEQLRRAGWDTEWERTTEDAVWEASTDAMELG